MVAETRPLRSCTLVRVHWIRARLSVWRLPRRATSRRLTARTSPTRSSATGRSTSCTCRASPRTSSTCGVSSRSREACGGSGRSRGSSSSTVAAPASRIGSTRRTCRRSRRGWTTSARSWMPPRSSGRRSSAPRTAPFSARSSRPPTPRASSPACSTVPGPVGCARPTTRGSGAHSSGTSTSETSTASGGRRTWPTGSRRGATRRTRPTRASVESSRPSCALGEPRRSLGVRDPVSGR